MFLQGVVSLVHDTNDRLSTGTPLHCAAYFARPRTLRCLIDLLRRRGLLDKNMNMGPIKPYEICKNVIDNPGNYKDIIPEHEFLHMDSTLLDKHKECLKMLEKAVNNPGVFGPETTLTHDDEADFFWCVLKP